MLKLETINEKNVWEIVNLHVRKEQESFVASNGESLIEAYVAVARNGSVFPFGLYDGETPVGFLMIGFDGIDSGDSAPKIVRGNYCIWRLMIDERYQHRGYGRKAVELALGFIRTFPCGEAEYCYLSYEPENICAKSLYAEFGFTENGEKDEEETVAVLRL